MSSYHGGEEQRRDAAHHLRQGIDELTERWCDELRRHVEVTKEVSSPALIDDVPEILALLADGLEAGTPKLGARFEPVRAHGEQRASMTFATVDLLLEELCLLRSVTILYLEEQVGTLARAPLLLLVALFDEVINISVVTYVNWQMKQEEASRHRLEKQAEQLSQLTDALREEREQRDLFVSAVVHDLRTPLASLQMASELLKNFSAQPDLRDNALQNMERNIQRLSSLAQRLLDVNRISAGQRLPMELESVNLSLLLRECTQDACIAYGEEKLTLELPDKEVKGQWNAQALQRIANNLIDNALKYGDPPVSVRLTAKDKCVCLSVHNQGAPILQEQQQEIFERFVRLSSAEDTGEPGWGIGLTIVRGLTEALGGELSLVSNAEDGTTFTVCLPWKSPSPSSG